MGPLGSPQAADVVDRVDPEERERDDHNDRTRGDRDHPDPTAPASPCGVLEVIDRDGHVRQVWPIRAWPLRVGRGLDNDVILSDPHVAAHHFSIRRAGDGTLELHTAPSLNGIALGGHRIPGDRVTPLALDDTDRLEWTAGRTRLRLRLPETALVPEVALAVATARPVRALPSAALGAALLGGIAFNAYLDTDPVTLARAAGGALVTAATVTAVWCGAWALLSKTITRQAHFGWHLRVFLIAALALLGLVAIPALLAFSLSWPWVTDFSFIPGYGVIAAALYFHLLALEPARTRLLKAVVATGAGVAVALTLWFNLQRASRLGDELYMSHLFPPMLRLAPAQPVERFVDGLASLKPVLDKKAAEPAGDGANDPGLRRNDDDE